MNILLLNLTRLGDLLQSQAAIAELASQGHRVGVVCLEPFSGVASLLSHVEYVAPLPGAGILSALDGKAVDSGEERGSLTPAAWVGALAGLAAWKERLVAEFVPDLVCNLTPTLSARLLGRFLAQDKPFTGFALDGHGFGVNSNGWAAFLQGASASRGVSPYNVVDLFRMVSRLPGEETARGRTGTVPDARLTLPDEALRSRVQAVLDATAPSGREGYVGLQLGASADCRRWPVEKFVRLGERLWMEEGLCPVLLGSKAEAGLAVEYGRLSGLPHVNMCGKTGLTELAATLTRCRLLVTNDTGTMHLAAGLGIPVLAVFLATAQPFDTGPYMEGACSVEPDLDCHPCAFGKTCSFDYRCRDAISAELMTALALNFLRTGNWSPPETGHEQDALCTGWVWVSRFDADGFMDLVSLSGHGVEDRTSWLTLLRHSLRQYIDRDRKLPFVHTAREAREYFSPQRAEQLRSELEQLLSLLNVLREWGKVLHARPMPSLQEKFLAAWRRVSTALEGSPDLAAFAVLWFEETQAEGQDLPHILDQAEQFAALLTSVFEEITT